MAETDGGPTIQVVDFTGVADPYNPGLDYPTAWAVQEECPDMEHHPRCSAQPKWGMLCDCGAVLREAERRGLLKERTHD